MCFFTALRVLFRKSNDRFLSGVSNKSGLPKLTYLYLYFAHWRSFLTFFIIQTPALSSCSSSHVNTNIRIVPIRVREHIVTTIKKKRPSKRYFFKNHDWLTLHRKNHGELPSNVKNLFDKHELGPRMGDFKVSLISIWSQNLTFGTFFTVL